MDAQPVMTRSPKRRATTGMRGEESASSRYESAEGRLWTVEEVCEILHVGRSTLYELMANGRLLYKPITKRIRLISDRNVQQYLDGCHSSYAQRWSRGRGKAS